MFEIIQYLFLQVNIAIKRRQNPIMTPMTTPIAMAMGSPRNINNKSPFKATKILGSKLFMLIIIILHVSKRLSRPDDCTTL